MRTIRPLRWYAAASYSVFALAVAGGASLTSSTARAQGTTPPPPAQAPAALALGEPVAMPAAPAPVPRAAAITLAQAVEAGLKQNPQVVAARYQVEAAQANFAGQRVPVNPTVAFAGVNNTVAPINFVNAENYALYATVETSGRLQARTRQSRAQYHSAQADAATTTLTVRQAVTNAYVALQVANRGLQDEQEAYATAAHLHDLTEKQFRAGAAPETNAIRTEVALTQEEANLFASVNAVEAARANLNVALGRDPNTPVDAAEALTYDPIHPKLEDLQAQALRARPEITSGEYARQALAANVAMQRAQSFPDVVLGTSGRFDQVFMGFTFPLFDLGSIRGAVRQAQKNVQVQEAQNTQERTQVELDVKAAYEALVLAERTVDAYQTGAVPRSESLLQRIERGYGLGFNTILDLLDAESNLRATRIAYYSAIGSYRQALAQLERAVGAPVTALHTAPAIQPPR